MTASNNGSGGFYSQNLMRRLSDHPTPPPSFSDYQRMRAAEGGNSMLSTNNNTNNNNNNRTGKGNRPSQHLMHMLKPQQQQQHLQSPVAENSARAVSPGLLTKSLSNGGDGIGGGHGKGRRSIDHEQAKVSCFSFQHIV